MHQDHNCTLIWQAPQAYSSWLNYEDLSPGIPNELQTSTLWLRFPQKWLIFFIQTKIEQFGNSGKTIRTGIKMTHFWDSDQLNMIFMQKVANGPDLIFVEFRKTVVRSTHPLYKCATTYLHTLHTVAKLKFLLKKWNLKKIFKKNIEKIIILTFFWQN